MPLPLSAKSGLGMKVTVLLCRFATLRTIVFVVLHVVGHSFIGGESNVDLSLTRGRELRDAGARSERPPSPTRDTFHCDCPARWSGWRHRKITFLCADLVTEIGKFFPRTVPMRFGAFD